MVKGWRSDWHQASGWSQCVTAILYDLRNVEGKMTKADNDVTAYMVEEVGCDSGDGDDVSRAANAV